MSVCCHVVVKFSPKRTPKFDKSEASDVGGGGFVGEELQAVDFGLLVIVPLHV